jgi:hypothetical protein
MSKFSATSCHLLGAGIVLAHTPTMAPPPLQIGIDMEDVAETLEKAGLESFGKSFDSLMDSLEKKSDQLTPA